MKFKQKQIWLINFDPSFGHEYQKIRPAVIIEDSSYIQSGNLITVLPISSKTENPSELDVYLAKDNRNRLMKDSLIKTHQISSFDNRRFIKFIGDCNPQVFKDLQENVKNTWGCQVTHFNCRDSLTGKGGTGRENAPINSFLSKNDLKELK